MDLMKDQKRIFRKEILKEILALSKIYSVEDIHKAIIYYIYSQKVCLLNDCNRPKKSDRFCRFHYIKYWNKIKDINSLISTNNFNEIIEKVNKDNSGDSFILRSWLLSLDSSAKVNIINHKLNDVIKKSTYKSLKKNKT